jgi:hypothetical protein
MKAGALRSQARKFLVREIGCNCQLHVIVSCLPDSAHSRR